MTKELTEKLDSAFEEMVEIRRYLHMHPEVSFQETKTAQYIQDFYTNLGIPFEANVGGNGVVARVKGALPGKTVALRADFDALPIQDEKDVPYKSTVDGVMHACGHDGHTATLLILARTINELKDELAGEYVFIHQHAEEYAPGGAKPMIEAGCLEGVDAIFGTHLWSLFPLGSIEYKTGPIMAAADRFEITIQGQGGHGANPHQSKDAIVVASQLVVNLQQLVARRVDPTQSAVLSVGSFVAENAFNIIADNVKLAGTVRTFDAGVRDLMERELERVLEGTCLAADCTYTLKYTRGYPPVINHKAETEFLAEVAKEVPGVELVKESELLMIGEDFGYYMEEIPGTFFFTGAMPEGEAYPHHSPKFDFDERAMLIAAKTLGTAAIQYQTK
ncbi:M20 metallopeptidase family protein [Psychrobacillus lasiicapitis]|uniref:Amidohydrolase n=1 Tax=Psychrobacillus lasiicapitis TaxID=1636719 RepID=A0A544SV97_9BACI|nr:M20 family metallopeptidase [Psychrobacillus lasiicapitis]TQR09139.1 amidohydrolase [Psychrobacillus lasiicapitis]GGA47795.1 putative amidohydrolase YhaA [Psychrobacillus lasiicapitis]